MTSKALVSEKIILGIPWFGTSFLCANAALSETSCAVPDSAPTPLFELGLPMPLSAVAQTYDALEKLPKPAERRSKRFYNATSETPFYDFLVSTGSNTFRRRVHYEDAVSTTKKLEEAHRSTVRGVGVWTADFLNYTTPGWTSGIRAAAPANSSALKGLSSEELWGAMAAYKNRTSPCAALGGRLPSFCTCDDLYAQSELRVECDVPLFAPRLGLNDTVGVISDVRPCADPSRIDIRVTERNHNVNVTLPVVAAGTDKMYPIPGLSVAVPGLGHAGIDIDVRLEGNPDKLGIKLGINACLEVGSRQVCGSSLPGVGTVLPVWLLSGNYTFGHVCRGDDQLRKAQSSKPGRWLAEQSFRR
jgi:hypothetical protein